MWEIYDKEKEYFLPSGARYTHEMVVAKMPVVEVETCVVNCIGRCVQEMDTLLQAMEKRNVPPMLTPEEACAYINEYDAGKGEETPALERIAAALEFIVLSYM